MGETFENSQEPLGSSFDYYNSILTSELVSHNLLNASYAARSRYFLELAKGVEEEQDYYILLSILVHLKFILKRTYDKELSVFEEEIIQEVIVDVFKTIKRQELELKVSVNSIVKYSILNQIKFINLGLAQPIKLPANAYDYVRHKARAQRYVNRLVSNQLLESSKRDSVILALSVMTLKMDNQAFEDFISQFTSEDLLNLCREVLAVIRDDFDLSEHPQLAKYLEQIECSKFILRDSYYVLISFRLISRMMYLDEDPDNDFIESILAPADQSEIESFELNSLDILVEQAIDKYCIIEPQRSHLKPIIRAELSARFGLFDSEGLIHGDTVAERAVSLKLTHKRLSYHLHNFLKFVAERDQDLLDYLLSVTNRAA